MTPHFVQSQEEAERLIGKVNSIVGLKAKLLKLNVKQTKRLKIGKIQSDAGVIDERTINKWRSNISNISDH